MKLRGVTAVGAQVTFQVPVGRPAVGIHNSQAVVNWIGLQNRLVTVAASIAYGHQWTPERPSERLHRLREVTHHHGTDGTGLIVLHLRLGAARRWGVWVILEPPRPLLDGSYRI